MNPWQLGSLGLLEDVASWWETYSYIRGVFKKRPNFLNSASTSTESALRLLSAPSVRFWRQTAICRISLWALLVELQPLNFEASASSSSTKCTVHIISFPYGAPAQRGPWPPYYLWGSNISHNDASQLVGLLWTSDQLVAETSTWQHTTLTTDKHPCPRRDSNPQSQQERPQTYALDRAATGTGAHTNIVSIIIWIWKIFRSIYSIRHWGNVLIKLIMHKDS